MRITLEIDGRLMRAAMRTGDTPTRQATVEAGLRLLIQTRRQAKIRRLRGKVRWSGAPNASRSGRYQDRVGQTLLSAKGRQLSH
jgi:Arc/MetJ family transcription regulator